MPLTPSNGDRHAMPLVRLYKALELALWRWIAKVLGLDGFGRRWLMRILMNIPRFRAGVSKLVDDAGDRAPALVREAITRGWADGTAAARIDTGSHRSHTDDRITNRLVDRVLDALDAANSGLPAATEAVLRRAVDHTTTAETAQQHREALERSLQRDARQGFTALVDTHGRRRELVAYVEAQIRNAVSTAEIEGYTQQLATDGHDLFVVSDVPGSCETCRPFEGKVISISGSTVGAITRNTTTRDAVAVHVMCSLREALDRGLFHPNCRHTIRVWTPENPAPPRAVRIPENVRTRRRVAAATQRRDRVAARVDAATGPDPNIAKKLRERTARRTLHKLQVPASPYDNARTAAEVGDILRQRHSFEVTGFDSAGIDLTVAQEFARALEDMIATYPNARLSAVRIAEPDADVPNRARARAYVRPNPGVAHNGGSAEMVFNINFARSYAEFREAKQYSEKIGWNTPASSSRPVYSTILHEWGHVLDNEGNQQARYSASLTLADYYFTTYPPSSGQTIPQSMAQFEAWMKQQLSGYSFDNKGDLNPAEALAEAFTDVKNNGDKASEAAKVLYKLLHDKLGGGAP